VDSIDGKVALFESENRGYCRGIITETHLIVDYLGTNQVTDHGMVASTLVEMKK